MIIILLILHGLLAVALLGAVTHQALSTRRLKPNGDRDSFMSLHPRAYDHNAQPYTINPYRKPTPTYYRVSPFDNANSYFKGTKAF